MFLLFYIPTISLIVSCYFAELFNLFPGLLWLYNHTSTCFHLALCFLPFKWMLANSLWFFSCISWVVSDWASFHQLHHYVCIFFREMSIRFFSHFLIGLLVFVSISCKCSLCIIGMKSLWNIWFQYIFSHLDYLTSLIINLKHKFLKSVYCCPLLLILLISYLRIDGKCWGHIYLPLCFFLMFTILSLTLKSIIHLCYFYIWHKIKVKLFFLLV